VAELPGCRVLEQRAEVAVSYQRSAISQTTKTDSKWAPVKLRADS
jgi:hypothetical protein